MKTTYLLLFLLFATRLTAQNFTISYTFDSVGTTTGTKDPTPLMNPAGVQCGSFAATGVSQNPNAKGRFSFTGWPTGAMNGATSYASLTGSADTGRYYQVSLAPQPGFLLSLNAITLLMQRSGTGIRTFSVRSGQDKFTNNLTASLLSTDTNLTLEPGNILFLHNDLTNIPAGCSITLGGTAFSSLTKPVTFRFYGFNAEGGGGTFSLDAVSFDGKADMISTGVVERQPAHIILTPNPSTDGLFHIRRKGEYNLSDGDEHVQIYTVTGRLIYQSKLKAEKDQLIDMSAEPSGIYFMEISGSNIFFSQKLVICR
jgi:hypothetical protein